MANKFMSIFSQILQIFNRAEFLSIAKETRADKAIKGFSCWDQFISMPFCQLGNAQSLREISYGLATFQGKLNHLGLKKAPSKSSLSYANKHIRIIEVWDNDKKESITLLTNHL